MDFEFNVPGATRLFPSFDDRNHGHTPLVLPSAMSEALKKLVLPVGIEPTTSPLPRECSTTELRQRSDTEMGHRHNWKAIHEVATAGKVSDLGGTHRQHCGRPENPDCGVGDLLTVSLHYRCIGDDERAPAP